MVSAKSNYIVQNYLSLQTRYFGCFVAKAHQAKLECLQPQATPGLTQDPDWSKQIQPVFITRFHTN